MNPIKILKSTEKFKIKPGLERVSKALELFYNPQNSINFIHVGGTNGKGSVCAILETILIDYGIKTGKYTSPHLFSYTERFSINGKNIEEKELCELIEEVLDKDREHNLGLTEFEILTVVCFLYFKKNDVDIAILEVGLGGRFDATNVIKKPLVSIITSISYDHKEILGDTIEKITKEKAGIFKKGAPAVFLKENKGYKTLKKIAEDVGARVVKDDIEVFVSNGFAKIDGKTVPFSLQGDFQAENLKLALLALKELRIKFNLKSLNKIKWIFRMEQFEIEGHKVLADSCHNPDGARVLREHLNKYYNKEKIKFIFGCLSNKDYTSVLNILYDKNYDFCFYEFDYPGALKYEKIKDIFPLRKIDDPIFEIKNHNGLTVVAGSIYMLGEIFNHSLKS